MTPLDVARGELGVVEKSHRNDGVPFERYALPGEEPLPWCARFVRYCFATAGVPLPGNKYLIGSVTALHDILKTRGALLSLEEPPRPGDLILLADRGQSDPQPHGHHIGIVEDVVGDNVMSIDGNWGDGVRRVSRMRGDREIWCFARWPVEAAG